MSPERLRQIEKDVANGRWPPLCDVQALIAEVRRLSVRPENDPGRPAHDREAWREARGEG